MPTREGVMTSNSPAAGQIYNAVAGNVSNSPGVSLVPGWAAAIENQQAPATAQYGQQLAGAEAGILGLPSALNTQASQLTQSTNLQGAQIQNQLAGNQLQSQNVTNEYLTAAAQQGSEVSAYGVSQQLLGLQGKEAQQAYGITQGQLAAQNQLLGTQEQVAGGQYGVTQAQLASQQANLNYQLPLAQQAQYGQNAASGSTNTVGAQNAQGTLQQQYGYNTAQLGFQGQQAALGYQGQQAQFTEQAAMNALAGTQAQQTLQNTQSQVGLESQQAAYQQQGEVWGYQGAQAGLQNQQQQLANTAAGLGISEQQLQAQLASGMNQIGVQGMATQDQLLQQASQAAAGETQGLGAVMSNVGALTGLGPQAFTQSYSNLYSGG
jgi:hypothetical protein